MKKKILTSIALTVFTIRIASAAVVSFTLVNADTNEDIQTLANGDTINLKELPSEKLNIRANVDETPKNVSFALSGATSHSNTEGLAPYALWGDKEGNYIAGTLNVGTHTLSARPAGGDTYVIHFKVIYYSKDIPTILGANKKPHGEDALFPHRTSFSCSPPPYAIRADS